MQETKKPVKTSKKKRHRYWIGLVLLAAAMILIGIFLFSELQEVQTNAHYLCFDCIGIG